MEVLMTSTWIPDEFIMIYVITMNTNELIMLEHSKWSVTKCCGITNMVKYYVTKVIISWVSIKRNKISCLLQGLKSGIKPVFLSIVILNFERPLKPSPNAIIIEIALVQSGRGGGWRWAEWWGKRGKEVGMNKGAAHIWKSSLNLEVNIWFFHSCTFKPMEFSVHHSYLMTCLLR